MPRKRSKVRPTHYNQLSAAAWEVVSGRQLAPQLDASLASYAGHSSLAPHFKKQLKRLKDAVKDMPSAPVWLQGYTLWANDPNSKRNNPKQFYNLVSGLCSGVFEFMQARGYVEINSSNITTKWVNELIEWLKTAPRKLKKRAAAVHGGGPRAYATARRHYGYFASVLSAVQKSEQMATMLHPNLTLPTQAFPDGKNRGKKTKSLQNDVWLSIYDAAVAEAKKTIETCRERWHILGKSFIPPNMKREQSQGYDNLPAVLWALKRKYRNQIPTLEQMQADLPRDLVKSIRSTFGYADVTLSFQPTPRTILPFALLLYIYSQANTSSLRTLKLKNIFKIEGFGGKRILMWLVKPRGEDYPRSFAIDEKDILSPDSIVEFLQKWTKPIRKLAGEFAKLLFIFVNKNGVIRPFAASSIPEIGTDACGHWETATKNFRQLHGLPHFVIGMLRMTGLQVIRERSGDDLLAHKAASGTMTEATIAAHYEGAEAELYRAEKLSQGMANQSRWVGSNGRIHQRGNNPAEDLDAATPGWNCLNLYQSPRPGQREFRACDGFGECPDCPNGVLAVDSPYAFARCTQLRAEIVKAFDYLDYSRWSKVFSPVASKLDSFWLQLFSDETIAAARLLNLDEFGELT